MATEIRGGLEALREALRTRYAEARPRSRALFEQSLASLPGGNSRSQLYFAPFPAYLVRGEGATVVDVDGFRYIDLLSNYTSLIHGHPSADFDALSRDFGRTGTAFGAPTPLEVEMARELCARVPSLERVRFTNSGTEAGLYAIRTARAFTGRSDVIKAEGGYHGGADWMQVSVKTLGTPNESVPELGVTEAVAAETHVVPFNDVDGAVRIVREVGPRSAAMIIEPMQGSAGAIPADRCFLEALREVTREVGCLLVFDEVMTLRLAPGGAQEIYGVAPDLTTMGKIIGGGFPLGAFGGRAEVMDVLDPRREAALSHSGTFNANPVSLAAGLDAMRRLTPERIAEINDRGERLRRFVAERSRHDGVPVCASGIGSLLQVHPGTVPPRSYREAAARPRLPIQCLFLQMLLGGVYIAPRGLMSISTTITDQDQLNVEGTFADAVGELALNVHRGDLAS
jgi:glutamate-1-semialdehyde 2,1-aminomutase